MSQCPSTAFVTPGGVAPVDDRTPVVRCCRPAGHRDFHFVNLEWDDAGIEWPEAHDPDEGFDVEVDALPHDEVIAARLAAESVGDDEAIERSHAAVDEAVRARLDVILEGHRQSIRRQADEASAAKTRELQARYGDGPMMRVPAWCRADVDVSPDMGFVCSLRRGHDGPHE